MPFLLLPQRSAGQRYSWRGRSLASLSVLAACVCLIGSATADETAPPVTRFSVRATGEPVPALKYRLLPPYIDLRPGNAALIYNKITVEFESWRNVDGQTRSQQVAEWLEMPIEQLPRAEVDKTLASLAGRLAELDRAARLETCDWQLNIRGEHPWSILLPEVQGMRNLARVVALRARLQIADGKYDEAIYTLQTGFAMARHVAEGPTLVNGLVGVAISSLMIEKLEALMRSPGAPNMYWALMALPRPIVDLRPGMDAETYFIDFSLPKLQNFEAANYSPEQWREQLIAAAALMGELMGVQNAQQPARDLTAAALAVKAYPRARQLMIAAGRTPQEVAQMPVAQVVLAGMLSDYRRIRDENFKWWYVPFWQHGQGPSHAQQMTRSAEQNVEGYPFINLLSASSAVMMAQVRGERNVAMHAAVEALRIHAAAHNGELPEQLSDVTLAPVLYDPTTGQPFQYAKNGRTATLKSPAPNKMSAEHFALHFEVTIVP